MPRVELVRETEIKKTGRVAQVSSLFDVQPTAGHRVEWNIDVPIEDKPWTVGLIVGPSGSGKSTIARHLFGDRVVVGFEWPSNQCILDGFPREMATDTASGLLSAVGFGAVPEWLRPFHVLSTGQQFRATLARALAENEGLVVVDEFTSVVDRQVAQICSAAVSKAVRRMERQFVAVTCHYDVEDWLDPDWVLDLGDAQRPFDWRSLQGRPPIQITLSRAVPEAWNLFAPHHYLSSDHPTGTVNVIAFIGDEPVAWCSLKRDFLHARLGKRWRLCRTVVLPQYQGLGIGMALRNYMCGTMKAWRCGRDDGDGSQGAHQGDVEIERMTCIRKLSTIGASKNVEYRGGSGSERPMASFRYIGLAHPDGPFEVVP